jgi:hypothetical protein
MDTNIAKLFVLNKYAVEITEINENNNDKNIGVLKNFKLIFLDHFESIEKNKKKHARTTMGINTAL